MAEIEGKKDIKIFSTTENIRLYIIEHTLHIETLIAEAIGSLLGIDYENSKSFGFSSSSLSFNQKVQIIQDINGLESEMAKKLACLMNIRNKFAHVQDVNSFESFFEIASNGIQIKNQLDNWYNLEKKKEEDETYKFLFFCLAEEITFMLGTLQVQKRVEKSVLQLEKDFQRRQLESYREVVAKSENGEKLIEEIFEITKKKLTQIDICKKG